MPRPPWPAAASVIEAEYVFPYLAHAPMEPLDGFLQWDGERAVARFGSQLQTGDQMTIAKRLGLTPDKVELADDAGRRQLRAPRAADHAPCRRARRGRQGDRTGRPVKLMWTREDDIRGGYYRAVVRASPARRGCATARSTAWIEHERRAVDPERIAVRGDDQERHRSHLGRRARTNCRTTIAEFPLRPAHHASRRADVVVAVGRPLTYRLCGRVLRGRTAGSDRQGPGRGPSRHDEQCSRAPAGVLRAVAELAGWIRPRPGERTRARRRGGRELRQLRRADCGSVGRERR